MLLKSWGHGGWTPWFVVLNGMIHCLWFLANIGGWMMLVYQLECLQDNKSKPTSLFGENLLVSHNFGPLSTNCNVPWKALNFMIEWLSSIPSWYLWHFSMKVLKFKPKCICISQYYPRKVLSRQYWGLSIVSKYHLKLQIKRSSVLLLKLLLCKQFMWTQLTYVSFAFVCLTHTSLFVRLET